MHVESRVRGGSLSDHAQRLLRDRHARMHAEVGPDPALGHLQPRPKLQRFLRNAADYDVRCFSVRPRMVDQHDDLSGHGRDSGRRFNNGLDIAVEETVRLGLRRLPDHDEVERFAGLQKSALEPVDHRQHRDENRDRQSDAHDRHHRAYTAHDQAPHVVFDWNHIVSVGPTVRIASVHRFAAALLPAGPPTPIPPCGAPHPRLRFATRSRRERTYWRRRRPVRSLRPASPSPT